MADANFTVDEKIVFEIAGYEGPLKAETLQVLEQRAHRVYRRLASEFECEMGVTTIEDFDSNASDACAMEMEIASEQNESASGFPERENRAIRSMQKVNDDTSVTRPQGSAKLPETRHNGQ